MVLLANPTNEIVESVIPFKGYEETIATNSFADYHIYYHTTNLLGTNNCQRKLLKPIIILDGFDPQDKRSFTKIYREQLSYTSNSTKLGDELRDKGYDVIILNFPKLGSVISGEGTVADTIVPKDVKISGTTSTLNKFDRDGGTDYMERNAFLLVKLIQQINDSLILNGSSEKLVVVGPSMGGQISRYALAYMEKQQSLGVAKMNHNTRLFVSFDSPNDGANIPYALHSNLFFFGYRGESQGAKDSYEQSLHSIAARQLLIEQLDGKNSSASFHQTFFNSVRNIGLSNSGGYPINLRKVALLNGSGSSIKTYEDGIENLFGEGRKTFLNLKVFLVKDKFMPSFGNSIEISKQKVTIPKFLGIKVINSTENITNLNTKGSMDAIQGSTYDATKSVYEGFYDQLEKSKVRQTWEILPNHCFIPTVSALAFKNPSFNWNNNLVNRNLLCNNEIWFDNYYMPKTNEEHVKLSNENVNWITEEIEKGQPNCPVICSYAINGLEKICLNSVTTYTLDNPVPTGYNVIWASSSIFQIISTTNNSITISGFLNGATEISAHIINPCGADVSIVKQIYIGDPFFGASYKNGITDGNPVAVYFPNQGINNLINNVCIGYGFPNVYIDAQSAGSTNLTWSVPSGYGNNAFSFMQQSGNRAYFGWNYGGSNAIGYLQASISNSCGVYNKIFAFKQVNCNPTGGDPCLSVGGFNFFTVSPNPVNDIINIGIGNKPPPIICNNLKALNSTNGLVFSLVNVYNNTGTLLKSIKTKNAKSVTFQINNLVTGSYFVEIIQDDYIEKHQIIVQK